MSLDFGTSGVRGLASEFNLSECCRYAIAFFKVARELGYKTDQVAIAGDYRDSTPVIKRLVMKSALLGNESITWLDGGVVPSPALALFCQERQVLGIMITGSHIPEDRNGIKFFFPDREILKAEEKKITEYYLQLQQSLADVNELTIHSQVSVIDSENEFEELYISRYSNFFKQSANPFPKIGFYMHSSCAKKVIPEIFKRLNLPITCFGSSEKFIAVDTEATQSLSKIKEWIDLYQLDFVISTDGDADRPLILDHQAMSIPGEILGLIASKTWGIETVVYPISCSTTVEKSGWLKKCIQTKIGSPYVIETLLSEKNNGSVKISGFEANGGFILAERLTDSLSSLMTRDSIFPILSFLRFLSENKIKRSDQLYALLPLKVNSSFLIKDIDQNNSEKILKDFLNRFTVENEYSSPLGVNQLDGMRMVFDEFIIHLRKSGNAPEFRIYIESATLKQNQLLFEKVKDVIHLILGI